MSLPRLRLRLGTDSKSITGGCTEAEEEELSPVKSIKMGGPLGTDPKRSYSNKRTINLIFNHKIEADFEEGKAVVVLPPNQSRLEVFE